MPEPHFQCVYYFIKSLNLNKNLNNYTYKVCSGIISVEAVRMRWIRLNGFLRGINCSTYLHRMFILSIFWWYTWLGVCLPLYTPIDNSVKMTLYKSCFLLLKKNAQDTWLVRSAHFLREVRFQHFHDCTKRSTFLRHPSQPPAPKVVHINILIQNIKYAKPYQ